MFWLLRMVYFEDSRFFCVSLKIICFCYTRQLTWLESNYIPSLGWQLKCQLNSFILSWSLYYIYVVLRSGWVYTQNFGSPSLAHFFPRSPVDLPMAVVTLTFVFWFFIPQRLKVFYQYFECLSQCLFQAVIWLTAVKTANSPVMPLFSKCLLFSRACLVLFIFQCLQVIVFCIVVICRKAESTMYVCM